MQLPDLALFDELTPAMRRTLEQSSTTRALLAGETLIREGEHPKELYFLVTGRLEIVKRAPGSTFEHRIHEVGPGESVGEVAFFDDRPRSATARALEPSVILAISHDAAAEVTPLVVHLGRVLAERLRASSEDELRAAQQRAMMGTLIVKIITLLCGYALLVGALPGLNLGSTSTTYVSLPIIFAFGWGAWRFIRSTGYPLSMYGLGFKNAILSLLEAAVLTPLFCLVLVGVKWIALQLHGPWNDLPLIERTDIASRLTEPGVVKLLVVYFVSAVVQEMIVRCALQSSLEELLTGPRKRSATLLVCALMFAVNHLHMSFRFACLAFGPGLFWGWLFARRRHLVGPALSHFAVGAFVFFIMGVTLP